MKKLILIIFLVLILAVVYVIGRGVNTVDPETDSSANVLDSNVELYPITVN